MTDQKPMRFIRLPGGKAVAWLLSDIEEWQLKCIADSKAEGLQNPPNDG